MNLDGVYINGSGTLRDPVIISEVINGPDVSDVCECKKRPQLSCDWVRAKIMEIKE